MFTCDEVLPFLGAETNSLFTELCSSMLSANICCSLFIFSPGGGGKRGTPLFGLCGHVPLNRVWFSRSWVYDFTIKRLEQGVFLDWKPSKSVKTCEERPTFAKPIIFFLNIYFSAKNYLILYAKQSKSGSESSVSCHGLKLNRVAKWEVFVLNRVGGCWPRRHTSTQTFLECSPPLPARDF